MISILIIDDHPLVSDGIGTMLKDVTFVQVVGACKTAREAIHFLAAYRPDIILLDINLPDMDGLQLCDTIRETNRQSKIVVLTSANEAGLISQLLKKGANGYLLKNMERSELLTAIETVLVGKVFLSKAANEKLLEQFHTLNDAVAQAPILTRREKEILLLLQEGFTGPQIADKLFLSQYTVETHRKNLMQKLNANNTQLLLKTARSYKLI